MYRKVAAIDVGSNAARLLIAKVVQTPSGFKAQKIILIRIPLRLGEDSFTQGIIGQQRINRLVRIMRAFAYLMRLHQVEVYMAYQPQPCAKHPTRRKSCIAFSRKRRLA